MPKHSFLIVSFC